MKSTYLSYREDDPTFRRNGHGDGMLYWLGRYATLKMTPEELHQLRLAVDQVDDIVNGPMK